MKPVIEKLLTEITAYFNTRTLNEADLYFNKAYKKLGREITFIRTKNLLSWIDPKFHTPDTDLEKYLIYQDYMDSSDFEEVYGEFVLLFKHLPELKEIFKLKDEHIEFNSSLSKNDIQEIYQFVATNYIINSKHVTRYYRPEK